MNSGLEQARFDQDIANTFSLKPFLKWAGGKRWLTGKLKRLWTLAEKPRVIEPFCGGLSVSLWLRPEKAVLNDLNPWLINLYRWVQQGLIIDIPMRNEDAFYYARRDAFNGLIMEHRYTSRRAACLFYYLNRTGFNGLCRFNQAGLYNVPFGDYARIPYRRQFPEYTEAFRDWVFYDGDFLDVQVQDGDFVYIDPPYADTFTAYTGAGFDWDDQIRLADWAAELPGTVAVSNAWMPKLTALYLDRGFSIDLVQAPRSISRDGDRTPAGEMFAFKQP